MKTTPSLAWVAVLYLVTLLGLLIIAVLVPAFAGEEKQGFNWQGLPVPTQVKTEDPVFMAYLPCPNGTVPVLGWDTEPGGGVGAVTAYLTAPDARVFLVFIVEPGQKPVSEGGDPTPAVYAKDKTGKVERISPANVGTAAEVCALGTK